MTNTSTTPSRADVTFRAVDEVWRTTGDISARLYASGFTWGPTVTRHVLQALHEVGRIQRYDSGSGYRWRRNPDGIPAGDLNPAGVTVDDLKAVANRVADLADELAKVQPATSRAASTTVVIGNECDLLTLTEAQEHLAKRIVKRTAYDTGKALLDVLDGWIEGVIEDGEARDVRDRPCTPDEVMFHADDIRRMVNDACRVMGAPEAYRA